ncbi:hypothetical protein [Flavilitoribacter nigricans]|uniref:Uncharacterized protein n=1 Tax=Flavilitoribacter nigricans (strain ATCC 23147 / DSM 23189 / NBRC 102662 / NCIMB 1420 / SS-2) TaxID=1122177 RepID=A0A2D0NKC0_FLAN2|nr:hypothetical protein [Flavilitoribacter nigricans]PHN08659.1 hypothetical protein CRP01_01745 [Flavilitoribacter nigricans DSM 23189 = NBRC 102662]
MRTYIGVFAIWITFFLSLISIPVSAASTSLPPQTELWYVTLEMDIQTLLDQRKTNTYVPAQFSFKDPDGQLVTWDIKVRARGRYRRMRCEFPPLKLKFPKQEMKAAGFGRHNDVKLVTHCEDNKEARENLFREYLTYQLYARLTNVSLRTQMIRITYRDSATGEEMVTYGMFIEDTDALAERLEAKDCENCYGVEHDDFDASNMRIHDLFQYMIGNTDWSREKYHNMKIFSPVKADGRKLMAPYDFDFSGLVNAAYAKPNVDLNQTAIRDRIYIGGRWTETEWTACLQLFRDKREELIDTVDAFKLIGGRARRDIREFLTEFYEELETGTLLPKLLPEN